MELVGIAHRGPGFGGLPGQDGPSGFERAAPSALVGGQRAAHLYGAGATLFEGGVVQVRIRVGVQDFVREGTRAGACRWPPSGCA